MTDDGLFSIGDLARRSGLPVRTIRFYSDAGVVPETARSAAGYRRYDLDAVARLDLVRTLRDLGLGLDTVRALLASQSSLPGVAAAHVNALDLQIKNLRLRRAVLRAASKTPTTPQEIAVMHKLVTMSDRDRQQVIDDFLAEAFGDLDANPGLVALLQTMRPELPDDPEPVQVQAWVELTELVRNPDFRAAVRRMAEYQAAERAAGDRTGLHHDLTVQVTEHVTAAIAAGTEPTSPEAAVVVDDLVARYARTFEQLDTTEYRAAVLHRLEVANDPRTGRYLQLLGLVNGWGPQPDLAPVFDWFTRALRTHSRVTSADAVTP